IWARTHLHIKAWNNARGQSSKTCFKIRLLRHSFEGWRVAGWLLAENPPAKRKRSAAAAKGRPTRGGYHRPSPRNKAPKVECDCIHDVSLSKFSRYLRATRV